MNNTHINPAQASQGRKKRFYVGLLAALLLIASVGFLLFRNMSDESAQGVGTYRNWSADAIIRGGAITEKELIDHYDKNSSGVQAIFKYYGISRSDLTGETSEIKYGVVHQNGNVVVNGKTVAVNAKSVSRVAFNDVHGNRPTPRNIGGATLHEGPNMSIFVRPVDAYVLYRDGQFYRAIISSCANPVIAEPTEPKAVYTCDNLKMNKVNRTRFNFTATATARHNASIESYTFDFNDGSRPITTKERTISHDYAKPGNYTAKVTANIKVDGSNKTVNSSACQVRITVDEPPKAPVSRCDNLQSQKINRNTFRFTATATAENGPQIVSYTFDFGDGSKPVTTTNRTYEHKYTKDGNFTAKVTANIRDGSTTRPVTGSACQTQVKVDPEPVYRCDSLTAKKINRTQFEFTVRAAALHGAEIVNYTYDFGDGTTRTVTGQSVSHTYTKPGNYTAKVTVNVRVNGENRPVSSNSCQESIRVEEPPKIPTYKCDLLTAKRIMGTDHLYAFELSYTAETGATLTKATIDFGDGKSETFTSANIDDIQHRYEEYGSYKAIATLHFNVQEENGVTERSSTCAVEINIPKPENCPLPGKEDLPKNSPECVEPPIETPPELPQTGFGTWISGGVGLAALTAAAYYWQASQSNLRSKRVKK